MTAAVVLFEGAGGSTAGLHVAGYSTVGFEHWQPAVTCAQANGFDSRLHDLSDPTLDHLVPYAPLWWASPPCQPFSAAGAGEGEFDGRDGFPWLLRLVALRLPDVLIVENVKGLTFAKHSSYLCDVLERLRALGYEVDWRVLNCADVGVPQTRERCIIVCRRDDGPITWPMPTHCETGGMFTARWVTMADALGRAEFVAHKVRGAGMEARSGPRPPRSADQPSFAVVSGGGRDPGGMMLYPLERIHQTVAAGAADSEPIRLTIPELAALQGFPPDWTWTGTKTQQARMVGNAVPPALAAAVANVNRPASMERAA